jgi:hypothetical protein
MTAIPTIKRRSPKLFLPHYILLTPGGRCEGNFSLWPTHRHGMQRSKVAC